MSSLSIFLHSSKSTIRLSFHFQNVTYESLDDIYCLKVQYRVQPPRAWMTASALCLIPPVRRRMSCCDSCCHSPCNDASNWQMFGTGGSRACIRRPNMSQICSMGIQIRAHGWPRNRSHGFALEVGGYCSWTMRPGVVIHIHRPCS
jgi:hypothetical protein